MRTLPGDRRSFFEPDPVNVLLLRKSKELHAGASINLWSGVVSDICGEVEFLFDEASGATGSIKDHSSNSFSLHAAYGMVRRSKVSSTTIDSYDMNRCSGARTLIKIDVEGAEREVLSGGEQFISQQRPVILVECFNPANLRPLVHADYLGGKIPTENNYLLFPSEIDVLMEPLRPLFPESFHPVRTFIPIT